MKRLEMFQGERLDIEGLGAIAGATITDWADKILSVILVDSKQTILHSWSSGEGGDTKLTMNAQGVFNIHIPGTMTRELLGKYYLELKYTDGSSIVGNDKICITVNNSIIGKETDL